MELYNIFFFFLCVFLLPTSHGATSNLFREYIGADLDSIRFTDVPINPNVDFHFILSFAIDYTSATENPEPTNGNFSVFWYTQHLTPFDVANIKFKHDNVRVAVSLGGDLITKNQKAFFAPKSTSSWVSNAVTSLTQIIKTYNLDGIDIDYEHFSADPDTFSECIGQLVTILKKDRIISFASIAPFDDDEVRRHYTTLWRKYGHVIDFVNFQFYAYDEIKSVDRFLSLYQLQMSEYNGGRILASFATDSEAQGGLGPDKGFFEACQELKRQGKLGGIFIWSADDSKKNGFKYEEQCQQLLISP